MLHGGDIYRNKVNIDFSVNLNPCPIPDEIGRAIEDGIKACNTYPDIRQEAVRQAISDSDGVSSDMILAGSSGSYYTTWF